MKNKKKAIVASIIILVAASILSVIIVSRISKPKSEIQFSTQVLKRGNIGSFVTATGTIEPVTEVEVGTQVSGIIDKIYVDYNSVVSKGELIAEMDRVTLESELLSAQANYDGALAEYNYQQSLYQRNTALNDKQLISEVSYLETTYNYLRAKSALLQAEASLAKAQRNLSYATITSPIDGVVTSRDVEEGQTVASGFETPTLFTIAADLTKMRVVADVDEADIAHVSEGNYVEFTVDAYPDDIFSGQVSQVRLGSTASSTSSTTTTVVTYEVVIAAENPELKLIPRLTANVTIYTSRKTDVNIVPNKALRFTPDAALLKGYTIVDTEAENKLWQIEGNTLKARKVTIGMTDGSNTEILGGLEPNQPFVTDINILSGNTPAPGEQEPSGETNPFMPGPPGQKKKSR